MVWDPPKQEVDVTRMIIYSFIPILSIYAGWRIQKFWLLLLLGYVLGLGISIPIQVVLPYPYGFGISIIASIIVSVLLVKHYAKKYNEKIRNISENS